MNKIKLSEIWDNKTPRLRSEINSAENLYKTLIENIPQKIFCKDKDGRWLSINSAFAADLKIKPVECIGKTDYDFFPKELADKYRSDDRRIMKAGNIESIEEEYIQDGELRKVHTTKTPLRDRNGNVTGIMGIFWDVTESKKAEEKMRNLTKSLEKAQEVAHLGSWELDLVHNRLSWSDEVYRIFGLKPQEFSATYEAFLERVYPDDRQKVDDAYGGSLRENSDSYEIEHRVVRKDTGKVRVVNERCEHLRDATGKITRSVGTVQDITDQKRNFDNLKKQEQEMSIMNRIAQILLNTPDENMYNEILKVLLEVTDSKLGTFGYIDENGDLIVPSLTRGAWWDQCNVPEKDIKFPCVNWGDGTWPRALREKKSNFTNEISMRVPKGHIPIKRHLTIPIIFRGESVGLIQIANRESDYTVEDIRLLENLASQIAPGLVARLQRDREEKKRKLVENQIKETVGILTEASAAILSAATQVTSSMMETTTAITEASITVEEVRQSARISSEKAKNVSDSAQRAAQASQSGQKAATENLVIMNGIREQMDSIAQTIIRLSEQSQSIGGIIASVTDIADQSNLLAVNAAIEAARAGEQGKSFAVVAQEMKILATQSKQATTQVRNILFDIQKATAEAVMATEKGSKSVETGVKQSKLTGEAIGILSEVSNDAIMASSQIVASSHQQVVGMDQIGVAIQSINQAGNETAVSMTQTESSARNLHELGRKLKEMVDKFKK